MNDSEFEALADSVLKQIETAFEENEIDADVSESSAGIIEIEFPDGSEMVINRHVANREIWVAARSGGYHFRWDGSAWRDTRGQGELLPILSRLVSQTIGQTVDLG